VVLEYIIQRGAASRERGAAFRESGAVLGVLVDARKAWIMGVDCPDEKPPEPMTLFLVARGR
jgi:hypothetical protein